jgi:NUMOD4 motif
MHEVWQSIQGYPKYMISNYGNVFNERTNKVMATSKTLQGDLKVTMVNGTSRITRSIRVLVAEAFVPKPYIDGGAEASLNCDTVIVLDNNKNHISADNLAWRPAWFAQKYNRQFKSMYPEYFYTREVLNVEDNIVYGSILECGVKEGLLFEDVVRSASTGDRIFPTGSSYELL